MNKLQQMLWILGDVFMTEFTNFAFLEVRYLKATNEVIFQFLIKIKNKPTENKKHQTFFYDLIFRNFVF